MNAPNAGDRAPDFTLTAGDGRAVSLSDFRGRKSVVVYFYPRDHTPGCTVEACAFRDRYEAFVDAGAEVIGISADDTASHQRFAAHQRLPFILLSDPDRAVAEKYGVKKALWVLPGRETFVIDRDGIVRLHFASQLDFTGHVKEALEALKAVQPA